MNAPNRSHIPANWPSPADKPAAAMLAERFAELGPEQSALAASPAIASLLASIGGNSPYLSDLILREPDIFGQYAAEGPDAATAQALAALAAIPHQSPRPAIAAALRQAKRQVALVTALADIGGAWNLAQVTGALSDLAEATLRTATAHLLAAAHRAGELRLPDPENPERGSGFVALGMGKLGGCELNYSSDIDLILLYDPDLHAWNEDGVGSVFTRLARNLVTLMEARDADGYVFRTDLRLRPDPSATPPAMSLPAAIAYYESMGQTWERAAMIKARPVAGDNAVGAYFLEAIRPFVWRRHLDFAALADIHGMKRKIDSHKGGALATAGTPAARIAGHNLKLGQGGIREIEFITQALQMVWGGHDRVLRNQTTLGALSALVAAGRLPAEHAAELAAAYDRLRRMEHRLQMAADRQTHSLPSKADELDRFAIFMGEPDAAALAAGLLPLLECVHSHFAGLFEEPSGPETETLLDFGDGEAAPEETLEALEALGFTNARGMAEAIRAWFAGRPRALRTPRAQGLMAQLLPSLLRALSRQHQPDVVFVRFDHLLNSLTAGIQVLSLFQRNPALLDRIATVLGAAPLLAEHLANTPSALEGLLAVSDVDPAPRATLTQLLVDARQLEDVFAITRRFIRGEEFRLSLATMEGRTGTNEAGIARTDLADATLSCLLPAVTEDFAARHGTIAGGAIGILAMGKAGGREMMAGSDLDLMLIYDHPGEITESTPPEGRPNAKPISASQYFARLAHAVIGAVTARGQEGPLYAVDMRLRPSGSKGPVAVSLDAFRRYHAEDAWTWERMALTRARFVAGPDHLRAKVDQALAAALADPGPPERIRTDALDMRRRIAQEIPGRSPWDVKHRPGGQIDVEFISQVLQLIHAPTNPGLRSQTTRIALARLGEAGILPAADTELLIRADHLWRSVQGMRRIAVGADAEQELPGPAIAALMQAIEGHPVPSRAGALGTGVDLARLLATMDRIARDVRAAFNRHVGPLDGGGTAGEPK